MSKDFAVSRHQIISNIDYATKFYRAEKLVSFVSLSRSDANKSTELSI